MSFLDNELATSAAAVSYSLILALFPTLLFLITVGNSIIGPEKVEKYLLRQVLDFFPGAYTFVRNNLESISNISTRLIISCFIAMVWAAMGIFSVIERALNRIWGTVPRSFLHGRAINFLTLILVVILLGASALSTALVTGLQSVAGDLPAKLGQQMQTIAGYFWHLVFILLSLAVTVILFTLLYKWLPNTKVSLREALTGAILAGVAWEAAKYGVSFLLPYFHYDLLHGSIGAAVALLSWVYTSSVIMLFGAQFTAVLHRDHLLEAAKEDNSPRLEESSVIVSE
jgi:membrane protein